MKNETELIKSTSKRQLTAKGHKFVWRCIDIIADQRGSNRYAPEMKPVKEQLIKLLDHLIIDRRHSIEDIKLMIQNRKTLSIWQVTEHKL